MTASLKPGALVWHPKTRTVGHVDRLPEEIQGDTGWWLWINGGAAEPIDGDTFADLHDGWVPVGVDGTVPEGHRLAIVSDSMVASHRRMAGDIEYPVHIADQFVALNPEHDAG